MNATAIARQNAVEARKVAYRQSKDGMVISFVLHPSEAPDDLATAPIGTRYMLAAVRIGDDEQPESGQGIPPAASPVHSDEQSREGAPSKPKRSWHQMLPSQRAGILCGDAAFQQWADCVNETQAADWLRDRCGVFSRKHLDQDDGARKIFERIEEDFQIAVGRVPPPR
jgi:hypothetical protein